VGLVRFGGQLGCVDYAARRSALRWISSHSAGLQ
jgi:hypothetical protein